MGVGAVPVVQEVCIIIAGRRGAPQMACELTRHKPSAAAPRHDSSMGYTVCFSSGARLAVGLLQLLDGGHQLVGVHHVAQVVDAVQVAARELEVLRQVDRLRAG